MRRNVLVAPARRERQPRHTRRLVQPRSSVGSAARAAASMREGLEETFTLQELGMTGARYRTLRTTNPQFPPHCLRRLHRRGTGTWGVSAGGDSRSPLVLKLLLD